jgi:hypothetical protein
MRAQPPVKQEAFMRKVVLTLVVSAVLTLPAVAATRRDTSNPGDFVHRIIAALSGAVIHAFDEVGVPKG